MKKSKKIRDQINEIKGRINKGIHRRVVRYAPAALGTLTAWLPVSLADASIPHRIDAKSNSLTTDNPHDDVIIRENTYNHLALAVDGNIKAYNQSIAQISIATESLSVNPKNPSAVATGNGYYGQHQFGVSASSGYMVKKYTAYALANGSEKFRESIMQNLLIGTKDSKQRLVEAFIASADTYFDRGEPEKAYLPSNRAYQRLFNAININPAAFTKVHNEFPEEGTERQKMFIYEVYLNLMPKSLKQTIVKHPRINFEEIHPAVMGSIIAIAVKQGNGARFDNALTELERISDREFYQKAHTDEIELHKQLGGDMPAPMTVVSRKGTVTPENIVARDKNAKDKVLIVYDSEGKISAEDILCEPGRRVIITKADRPKSAKSDYSIITYDISAQKIATGEKINTAEWLKNYCRGFSKVYQVAARELDKIPTLETYMEMSIILNRPQLYDIMQKLYHRKKENEFDTTVRLSPDLFRQKTAQDKQIMLADNARVDKISLFREKMMQYRQKQKDNKIARIIDSFTGNKSHRC